MGRPFPLPSFGGNEVALLGKGGKEGGGTLPCFGGRQAKNRRARQDPVGRGKKVESMAPPKRDPHLTFANGGRKWLVRVAGGPSYPIIHLPRQDRAIDESRFWPGPWLAGPRPPSSPTPLAPEGGQSEVILVGKADATGVGTTRQTCDRPPKAARRPDRAPPPSPSKKKRDAPGAAAARKPRTAASPARGPPAPASKGGRTTTARAGPQSDARTETRAGPRKGRGGVVV